MGNKIVVKGKEVGGNRPLICTPMVGQTLTGLLDEVEAILWTQPDMVEWRADYLKNGADSADYIKILKELNEKLWAYPLIFTLRIDAEGGALPIAPEKRLAIIQAVLATGLVNFVDVELCSGPDFLGAVIETAHKNKTWVIVSNHDFLATPVEEDMQNRLVNARAAGGDIVKLAVMPHTPADVLALMKVTDSFHTAYPHTPVITMSMGQLGVVTRIGGGVFGSAVTFGMLNEASAPGQLTVAALRSAQGMLYQQSMSSQMETARVSNRGEAHEDR